MFGMKNKIRLHVVIKDHCIRYAFSTHTSPQQLTAYGEVFLPRDLIKEGVIQDARRFEMQMEDILWKHKMRKASLFFTVPDASAIIRVHIVPGTLKQEEVKGYLYQQIGESLHLPFEQPVLDFGIIRSEGADTYILLVAYPEERVELLEKSFSQVRLIPKAAELSSLSIYRLYHKFKRVRREDHMLLIEWNVDGIVLTVFHNEIPQFSRHMKSTLLLDQWRYKKYEEQTRIYFEGKEMDLYAYVVDQLAEVERIMSFYKFSVTNGNADITNIVLSGDWPYFEELKQQAEDKFTVPVETIEPKELGFNFPAQYCDVIGLSLKE